MYRRGPQVGSLPNRNYIQLNCLLEGFLAISLHNKRRPDAPRRFRTVPSIHRSSCNIIFADTGNPLLFGTQPSS